MKILHERRNYLPFLFSMFIIGIAASASFPLMTLFLVDELHVMPATAGLFFLTSLVSPVISILTGKLSDNLPSRKGLIVLSSLWLATGWILMAWTYEMWMAIVIGLCFFGISSTLSAQIFALLRDVIDANRETHINVVNSTVRSMFSFGWIIGPLLGSGLTFFWGIRATFLCTAALEVAAILPLLFLKSWESSASTRKASKTASLSSGEKVHILCFALVCIFLLSGDTIKLAYLPLYIVQNLKENVVVFGSLLSVSAIAELLLMPFFGVLADKFSLKVMMIIGICFSIIEFFILAGSTSVWPIYITQIFHAIVISVIYGLGVNYAQQLFRKQTGLASSVFFSAQSLASPFGSLVGSYGLIFLGMPYLFFLPFGNSIIALLLLLLGGRKKTSGEQIVQKESQEPIT